MQCSHICQCVLYLFALIDCYLQEELTTTLTQKIDHEHQQLTTTKKDLDETSEEKKVRKIQKHYIILFSLACVASARLYVTISGDVRRRQHIRLKFACSLFYGSNSKSVQPIVLKPDSNDPVECLLDIWVPMLCASFRNFAFYNLLNLFSILGITNFQQCCNYSW